MRKKPPEENPVAVLTPEVWAPGPSFAALQASLKSLLGSLPPGQQKRVLIAALPESAPQDIDLLGRLYDQENGTLAVEGLPQPDPLEGSDNFVAR